jgi:hypothetical protein
VLVRKQLLDGRAEMQAKQIADSVEENVQPFALLQLVARIDKVGNHVIDVPSAGLTVLLLQVENLTN